MLEVKIRQIISEEAKKFQVRFKEPSGHVYKLESVAYFKIFYESDIITVRLPNKELKIINKIMYKCSIEEARRLWDLFIESGITFSRTILPVNSEFTFLILPVS